MPLPAVTMNLPPGTIKNSDLSGSSIVLVVRVFSISVKVGSSFWSAPQSSIHLRGPIAARSISRSLISGMGKPGRKRLLSRHTRWKTATQTIRWREASSRALQVLTCFKQTQKKKLILIDDIPCAEPIYRTDEEICRLWSVNPMESLQGWAPVPLRLKVAREEKKDDRSNCGRSSYSFVTKCPCDCSL